MLCANFILFNSGFAIIIGFILYGLHKAALEDTQKAFISELAPPGYRASILDSFQMITGLSALPASFIAEILWNKFNSTIPFYFALGLTILAIILMLFVKKNKTSSNQ